MKEPSAISEAVFMFLLMGFFVISIPVTIFLPLASMSNTADLGILGAFGLMAGIAIAAARRSLLIVALLSAILYWSRFVLYPDWAMQWHWIEIATALMPFALTGLAWWWKRQHSQRD